MAEPRYALVELDQSFAGGQVVEADWNRDAELARLGQARASGSGCAAAFPMDPVSIGVAILITVAADVTTAAIMAGVGKLMEKKEPADAFEIEIVQSPTSDGVIRIRVKGRGH